MALEDESCPFGLTPFHSIQQKKETFHKLAQSEAPTVFEDFSNIRFVEDERKLDAVHRFLKSIRSLPHKHHSPAELRELWCLIFGFRDFEIPIA